MDEGYKITETTDKSSALSMLLEESDPVNLDLINRMVKYIIEDEIIKDIDGLSIDAETSIRITQHLKPVQH